MLVGLFFADHFWALSGLKEPQRSADLWTLKFSVQPLIHRAQLWSVLATGRVGVPLTGIFNLSFNDTHLGLLRNSLFDYTGQCPQCCSERRE